MIFVSHKMGQKKYLKIQFRFRFYNKAAQKNAVNIKFNRFPIQGITEDTPNFRQRHDYAQYGRFNPGGDPFESFFDDFFGGGGGGGGGRFR